jgi:hypothetical protein
MTSKSKIPRALRTDLRDDGLGQSQFVETRVIQPTSGWSGSSQGQIRFLLPKQGILDKSSYIKFQILGATANHRLPLTAGALSAFETATLFCGGIQVAQTRGVGQLLNLKQFYRTPHDRNAKQAQRVGCFAGQMIDGTTTGGTNKPGHIGINTHETWATGGGTAFATDDREISTGFKLTNSASTTPEWRLYVEELFPLLYNNNLPLGLIDEEFSIVLDLSPDEAKGQRAIMTGANVWATGTNVIKPSLHVDLVFYDDPINAPTTMDKLRAVLDKGEKIVFEDSQYILQNQPAAGAAGEQSINVLLGLDHQIVRNILVATPLAVSYAAAGANNGDPILGQYYSIGSSVQSASTGKGGNTLQLTINSQPIYPNPLDSDNKIWDQLSQVYPTPFKINLAQSSFVGQTNAAGAVVATQNRFTDKTLFGAGHAQTSLCGKGHYYGINLSRTYSNVLGAGTSVGRQPVLLELTDNRPATDLAAKIVHIWAACERVMMVQNGRVRVSGS